ncbi:uncharacterized protein LOC122527204 [Frieseomelitta varia]|uniref:uncharacterized protein LOC122527204 n=1 Tax=Frieseomelitta varia TaxID=561572 RepID=UPI001CB6A93D|nr:uncharacterized protein LOC122527204 [Frieseomelitta varia]
MRKTRTINDSRAKNANGKEKKIGIRSYFHTSVNFAERTTHRPSLEQTGNLGVRNKRQQIVYQMNLVSVKYLEGLIITDMEKLRSMSIKQALQLFLAHRKAQCIAGKQDLRNRKK